MSEIGGQGIKGSEGAGGGGEANTGNNVGVGVGLIFRDKTGVILNFKSLIAGANITINNNVDDIEIIGVAPSGEVNTSSNVGTGEGLAKAKVVFDLPFKSLLGTANEITLVGNVNDVTFSLNALVARLNIIQTWTAKQTFLSNGFALRDFDNTDDINFVTSSEIADRTIQIPILGANQVLVLRDLIQTLVSKTVNLTNNTLIDSLRATGDIPKDNGTKYVRFGRGAASTLHQRR